MGPRCSYEFRVSGLGVKDLGLGMQGLGYMRD